ncbi:uncharacterized protein RAG0_10336 [Rhynchosporium agropyri]|uniref:Uncharacterized protein n=1 Tax=Rhynchosporium agropyri TaxID=914238 RepID=A0A1E1KZD9_9HELO|nr:uncharacterized protein RAG0_10336 [Rhynchosporium agropyri]
MIEEENGALHIFIRLASFDHIESTIIPELLWVLGYSMAAPILADEVMHTILRIYDNSCDSKQHQTPRAEAAHIADLQAPARSKLNRFVMDYVASFGPSQILESDCLETSSDYVTDWQVFIHGGGDLVWFIRKYLYKYLIYATSLPAQQFPKQGKYIKAPVLNQALHLWVGIR